jgi:hypothetical protein
MLFFSIETIPSIGLLTEKFVKEILPYTLFSLGARGARAYLNREV